MITQNSCGPLSGLDWEDRFDVLAGKTTRAPHWMQKASLEWLYRLYKEPSRIGRMMALPRFVLAVQKEKEPINRQRVLNCIIITK